MIVDKSKIQSDKIIYILLLLLAGCNIVTKKKYEKYSDFPNSYFLQAEIICLDTFFRYPFRIVVKDDIAIIHDLHNSENYLHAFLLPKWEFIISFASRGISPEEMSFCETFQFISLDSIWALDPNKMCIYRYKLYLQEKKIINEETISLEKNLLRSLDFVVTSSGFIVPDYTGEYRYHIINWQGDIIKSNGFIPTEKINKQNIPLAQAWRPFIDCNEATNHIAIVTQLGEVLEIYNSIDSLHIVKYGVNKEPLFVEKQENVLLNGIMGFRDIQISNQYIYTIFDGTSFKEIRDIVQSGKNPPQGGKYIYVFDLEGNPVKKYELNHRITGFDVHEEENIIYAVDVNNPDLVLTFTLPSDN